MTRDDPFNELERVFGLMSKQFGRDLVGVPVDVLDTGDAFEVRADLPGYDADTIEVTVSGGQTLDVEAHREIERESADETAGEGDERTEGESGVHYVRRERERASASRSVSLPEPVDEAGTTATYEDGVLTVRLPKASADDEGTDIPVS